MKAPRGGVKVALAALFALTCSAARADEPAVSLSPLTGPLYLVEDAHYAKTNSLVYVGPTAVTVIGATWTPETARQLAEQIRRVTDEPIGEVVDVGYNPEYAGGNATWKSLGAQIVATELTAHLLERNWDEIVDFVRKTYPDYPRLPVVLPTVTHRDSFTVQGGAVQVLYLGRSHAADDVFVWFPHEKVLYAGSILKERLGNLAFADLEEYPKTLRKLQMLHLDVATVISGHWSAVHGPELFDQVLAMLAEHPAAPPTLPVPPVPTGTLSELLAEASRRFAAADYVQAAAFFAAADRAASGKALPAVAGLCQASLKLEKYDDAIGAAERWVALASTPAERAGGRYYLGIGWYWRGVEERLSGLGAGRVGGRRRRAPGADSFQRAADALRLAADEGSEGLQTTLLSLADAQVQLGAYEEALKTLDEYAAAGGTDPFAADLRCWSRIASVGPSRSARATGGGVFVLGKGVAPPQELGVSQADLVSILKGAQVAGSLSMRLIVDERGEVACVRLRDDSARAPDAALFGAVRRVRFTPAEVNGVPVAVYYDVAERFGGPPPASPQGKSVEAAAATPSPPPAIRSPTALLGAADDLVVRGDYGEALKLLDEYAASGGDDPLAKDLRCWAETATAKPVGLHRSDEVGFRQAVKIFAPQPGYTQAGLKAEIEGSLRLRLLVDDEGRVVCTLLLQGLGGGLDVASAEAVKKWRFRPATLDGEPVSTSWDLTVQFSFQHPQH
jgi:metallo-beta-lactamase class B